MDAVEAVGMNEQETFHKERFVMILAILFGLLWFFGQASKVPSFDPIPDISSDLMDDLDKIQDALKQPEECKHEQPPIDSEPVKKEIREIIMFSSKSCPPCKRWWDVERETFERRGYTVAMCYDHQYAKTPTFAITDGSKSIEIVGYMTPDQLAKELAK